MAELKKVINGTARKVVNKKRKPAKRRKNSASVSAPRATAARSVVNPKRKRRTRRRNGVTALALVPNKKKRRRRNGAVAKRRNGFFGDSKETVTAVVSLGGGMALAKIGGNMLNKMVGGFAAQAGLGAYSAALSEGIVAVVVNKFAGNALGGKDAGKFAMLGGLAIATLDGVNALLGADSPLNVFALNTGNSPVIVNSQAAGAIAAATLQDAAKNGIPATAAKLSGFMRGNGGMRMVRPSTRRPTADLNRVL